jgi:hypothetical protein
MRYRIKSNTALDLVLGDLPDTTRVEIDPSIKQSAKNNTRPSQLTGVARDRSRDDPPGARSR